jgi:hypothetical protein
LIRVAAWFQILCHLQQHIASNVLAKVEQGYNRNEIMPEPRTIRLYRSDEGPLNLWMRKSGTLVIAIDVWEGNDDDSPKIANQCLAELEDSLQTALETWPIAAAKDLKMKIDVAIPSVKGDGENYRPMCAAFYLVAVQWKK